MCRCLFWFVPRSGHKTHNKKGDAWDLLACVDTAAIIHNGKVVAHGTPTNLIQNIDAQNVYFGESFKIS